MGKPGPKPKLTAEIMKRGAREGLTLQEVADKHDVSYQTVVQSARKHGVRFDRATSESTRKTDQIICEVLRMTLSGAHITQAEIARKFNMTRSGVNKVFKMMRDRGCDV